MSSRIFNSLASGTNPKGASPTKCHYTMHRYICTHKIWLKTPRIKHVAPCILSTNPFQNSKSRTRCPNLASAPFSVDVPELCPKCQPPTLGAENKMVSYLKHEVQNGKLDWSVEVSELARGMKTLSLETTSARKERNGEDSASRDDAKLKIIEGTAVEKNLAVATCDDEEPLEKISWINIDVNSLPSAGNGDSVTASPSIFQTVVGAFMPGASTTVTSANDANNTKEKQVHGQAKLGWVEIEDDSDWEAVGGDEKYEGKPQVPMTISERVS